MGCRLPLGRLKSPLLRALLAASVRTGTEMVPFKGWCDRRMAPTERLARTNRGNGTNRTARSVGSRS
jgi:hypothetical protein